MNKKNLHNVHLTNDKMIRSALRTLLNQELKLYRENGHHSQIIEELGVSHGNARIDYAIINGIMHGFEIKSDRDTLKRLPEQVKEFSAIFDKVTLVVGKSHLYKAIHEIPEWWGILVVKTDNKGKIIFQNIRTPETNIDQQVKVSIARLLWRKEALQILEQKNNAIGVRSKSREVIYSKLANVLDLKTLKEAVTSSLISREGWRFD